MPALPDDQLETLPAASAHPPGAPDDVDAANLPTSSSDGLESLEILREIARAPARQPAVMLSPGGRWGDGGRYVIERRLGRGGMGSVYAARDTVLDRRVALKLLDAAQRDDRDRVLREAKLAARVEHERIARVYDAGVHDGEIVAAPRCWGSHLESAGRRAVRRCRRSASSSRSVANRLVSIR